jgi:hypothetical protein
VGTEERRVSSHFLGERVAERGRTPLSFGEEEGKR